MYTKCKFKETRLGTIDKTREESTAATDHYRSMDAGVVSPRPNQLQPSHPNYLIENALKAVLYLANMLDKTKRESYRQRISTSLCVKGIRVSFISSSKF